jgi:hypothetical protein
MLTVIVVVVAALLLLHLVWFTISALAIRLFGSPKPIARRMAEGSIPPKRSEPWL